MVVGFPSDSFKVRPVEEGPAMFFLGNIEMNPTAENFDPRYHLALAVDEHGLELTDAGTVDVDIPLFNGMSGCSIWRVAPITMTDPDSWDPSMVRLVAIQNRADPGNHTTGTWFRYVVDRIIDSYPHLKPATEIQYKPGY
jgi:hypothetical protein